MRSFFLSGVWGVLLSLLCGEYAIAQEAASDSLLSSALLYAKGVYHDKINERGGIFSGPQYSKIANAIGHPFFQNAEVQKGQLRYEELLFADVDMLYDTHADQLIVKYPNSALYFSLLNERIASFTLNHHTFQWLRPNRPIENALPAGFYDILLEDTLGVAAKRTKLLTKIIVDKKVVSKYDEKDSFYYVNNGIWYLINAKKDIVKIFPNIRKDLLKYMKNSKIKFNKIDRESYIITAGKFINTKL